MAARKGRFTKLWLDGYALTSNANMLEAGSTYDEIEGGAFDSSGKSYLSGRAEAMINFDGYFDPSTSATHDALKTVGADKMAGFALGNNAAATIGDIAGAMPLHQTGYTVSSELDGVIAAGGVFKSVGTALEWGVLLADVSAATASGNTTSHNNSASSTAGGAAYLFLTGVSSGDSITVLVEDSPDNATWATLATFTLTGSAAGAERLAISGTIDQYTRVSYTITGTSPSFDFAVILSRT